MSRSEEIQKGCGKQYYNTEFEDVAVCGVDKRDGLCYECRAELKGIQETESRILGGVLKILNCKIRDLKERLPELIINTSIFAMEMSIKELEEIRKLIKEIFKQELTKKIKEVV